MFLLWGLWFCFAFCFLFLGEFLFNTLAYTSLRPDCVMLFWVYLCFHLGIVYFSLGSLSPSPDWRWVIIFRFGCACFCAGLAGYVFESCFFVFVPFGHHIYVLWGNTTRHAQPIISIPEINPLSFISICFLWEEGMRYIFVRFRVLMP